MKRPMETAQWSDCETDEERAEYLVSGRVNYAGINRMMLVALVTKAFEDAAKWRAQEETAKHAIDMAIGTWNYSVARVAGAEKMAAIRENARIKAELSQYGIVPRAIPPWGPDAVPLMACEDAEELFECKRCFRSTPHVCDYFCKLGSCLACGVNDDACVQVGWRERSKPK